MKPSTVVGILLILGGTVGFIMGGFSFKQEKRDVAMGPILLEHRQTRHVVIPPVLSGILLVGGIGLLIAGARR